MTIPLMKSSLLNERATLDKLADWLRTYPAQLSMGPLCAQFEREFSAWQGRKHAVLFNSGGSANLALLQALLNLGRLSVGDSVGFSALTWATNVMPIMQLGMVPVPVDVDTTTLNVMMGNLKADMTVKALFLTNALGFTGNIDWISAWCKSPGIILLEDNCESLGSRVEGGYKAGNFGLAATFSFFVAHHMSTIEGGLVATDDPALDEMLRMVRANGWDRNLPPEQKEAWREEYNVPDDFEAAYKFYVPGYNLRPTEITGFLGLEQLKLLDDNLRDRAVVFEALERCAAGNPDLIALDHSHMQFLAPFCYPVICKTPDLRARYIARFAAAGVEVRPIIAGDITRQPFYRAVYGVTGLPGADFVSVHGFYFGIYPELSIDDIETLMACLMGA